MNAKGLARVRTVHLEENVGSSNTRATYCVDYGADEQELSVLDPLDRRNVLKPLEYIQGNLDIRASYYPAAVSFRKTLLIKTYRQICSPESSRCTFRAKLSPTFG